MSVFDSIKGTIVNVQQDISSGLRSLTSPTKPEASRKLSSSSGGINYESSAELLDKHQSLWQDLHNNAEHAASTALSVDSYATEIFLRLERQNEAMNQFSEEVKKIPQIVADVKTVMNKIGQLEILFSEVNDGLAYLEDIRDRQVLLKDMKQHQLQLQLYANKQTAQLDQLRAQLSAEHAYKVQVHEAKLQGMLREKQQAFEAAFSEELHKYKTSGQTEFKPAEKTEPEKSLADIDLEQDSTALDDFLQSQDLSESDSQNEKEEKTEREEDKIEVKSDEDFIADET